MKKTLTILVALLVITTATQAVTIDMVTVGNAGNAAHSSGKGAVAYDFMMGKFEITQGQYVEFLNAKAGIADPYGLFQSGGLAETVSYEGSGIYSVPAGDANKPMTEVNFGDIVRFANWMHNGQGSGDTENGAYDVNGATSAAALALVTRQAGALFFVPTVDELTKAGWHKNDGVTGNYFDYGMSFSGIPDDLGSDLTEATKTGRNLNINITGYFPGYTTDVGDFELSASPYGAFDMSGNVNELTESIIGNNHVFLGGAFLDTKTSATIKVGWGASIALNNTAQGFKYGFRLGAPIPEPATMSLLALGGLAMLKRRRNK